MPSFFLRLFLRQAEDHNRKPSFRLCFAEPHIEADPVGTADKAAGIPVGQAAGIAADTEAEPAADTEVEPVVDTEVESAVEIAADTADSSAQVLQAETRAVQVRGRAQVPEQEREPQLQE